MGKENRPSKRSNIKREQSGKDIEFSMEFADEDDKEALARSRAADRRVKEDK